MLGVIPVFVVLSLLCLAWYAYVQSYRKPSPASKAIPGPVSFPLIGNVWDFNVGNDRLLQLIHKFWREKYGRIYQYWIGPTPYVALSSPDSIQVILSSSKLINKSRDYLFLEDWVGKGLITSQGSRWKSRRKMLTPTFHFKILENFVPIMQENVALMIQIMEDQIQNQQRNTFDIYDSVSRCTLDIIAQTAMGVNVKAQEEPESKYVRAVSRLTHIMQYRMFRPWLWSKSIFKRTSLGRENREIRDYIHKYADTIIEDCYRSSDSIKLDDVIDSDFLPKSDHPWMGTIPVYCTFTWARQAKKFKQDRVAFLDLLLNKHRVTGELSLVDIRDEVNTFMFAGHDTTAVSTSFLLYALATNPDAQERLYQELNAYFGESDQLFAIEDVGVLPYLECCIKEGLRFYSTVPFVARTITEDVKVGDYVIKKNSVAMILMYAMHHDPEYFPEPWSFRPERFLPENSPSHYPYAYIPFSAGPRNCIGQRFANLEEKILVSSVVRRYRVETDIPPSEVVLSSDGILRSRDPLMLRLISR